MESVDGSSLRVVSSEKEMIELGAEVGASLSGGDVLALVGDLGAGKTQFVKGLAIGIESADAVTSPTFTLIHEYTGGRIPLLHFDFYRIEFEEELLGIGWDEYLEARNGIVAVEWADKFPRLLPAEARWLRFEILDGDIRRVRMEEVN